MKNNTAVIAGCALSLFGCSTPDVNVYSGKEPAIAVKEFYSAPIEGYGFYQEPGGKVIERFYATLVPTWSGNEGTIVEKQWNDKGKLFFQQTWKLHVADNGQDFTATATKIDGLVQGATRGYAMHMTYVLLSPTEKDGDIKLNADDWTYLQPDGTGVNKVAVSKYGLHAGDITYILHPVPEGEELHEGYFPD